MNSPANMVKMMAFVNTSRSLCADLGRMPTAGEMASELGISVHGAAILLDRATRSMGEVVDADFQRALAELPQPQEPGVPDDVLQGLDLAAIERMIREKLGE